jgi:hypothetical protein
MDTKKIHFLNYSIEIAPSIERPRSRKSILLILGPDARREIGRIRMFPTGDTLEHIAPLRYGSLVDAMSIDAFKKIITTIYQMVISQPMAGNHLDSWIGRWLFTAHADENHSINPQSIHLQKIETQ